MDRGTGSPCTRSVVGVCGPGASVFGLPLQHSFLAEFRCNETVQIANFDSDLVHGCNFSLVLHFLLLN